ncbi:MFS transporter [Sulfidibacter corallicola]|uniref:MFS transporter n=1 Tax=Sulfidibacter corallicola TaxID=2818388 RepID=A0A8A4U2U4_SULCO|nr:MFS transporter [Sulfidibacter corallicola]QTD53055.1 MFS transporter [Sulfidibacter corallicola]
MKGSASWRGLPGTVIALGLVSFFTDLSSEMIYPLLPLFLTTVLGTGAVALGVVEGVAESTAALLKLYSGYLTDRTGKRKPFIFFGYGLAGAVRPLIGLAGSWTVVLFLRFADRIGKGFRSSPRDALIADVTPPERRGAAYGVHRAMDHAGAVAGPLCAAALLYGAEWSLRQVFLFALLPGIAVMFLIAFGVKDQGGRVGGKRPPELRREWSRFDRRFHWFLIVLAIFSLGNASDAFLLLALSDAGVPAHWIALLWAAHNGLKMLVTWLAGGWSDRFGRARFVMLGWFLYAIIYLGFGWSGDLWLSVVLFVAYGVVFGLTEPVEKALVADFAGAESRGTAFGYYHFVVGMTALPASLWFGVVWHYLGRSWAFALGGLLAAVAMVGFRYRVSRGLATDGPVAGE